MFVEVNQSHFNAILGCINQLDTVSTELCSRYYGSDYVRQPTTLCTDMRETSNGTIIITTS